MLISLHIFSVECENYVWVRSLNKHSPAQVEIDFVDLESGKFSPRERVSGIPDCRFTFTSVARRFSHFFPSILVLEYFVLHMTCMVGHFAESSHNHHYDQMFFEGLALFRVFSMALQPTHPARGLFR